MGKLRQSFSGSGFFFKKRSKVDEKADISVADKADISSDSLYSEEDFPEITEDDLPENPPSINLMPMNFMKKFRFLPVDDSEDFLVVIMFDPCDFNTREIIRKRYDKPLKVYKASEDLISQYLYRWYEADADMADEDNEDDISLEDQLWEDPEQLKGMASEAPVIRLVNHIINRALEAGASDIHIEPRRYSVQVRYRIDGVLHDQEAISVKQRAAITSRIKLMAKLDIAERRLPQDGRIKIKSGKDEVDIRVSSIPVSFGESLVLRLLHTESVELDLNAVGFSGIALEKFRKTIHLPYGIILVTGPTGSGKTTTLYSALNEINAPDKKIVTVEDPVEYQLNGINQVQVHASIGLTFVNTLRSFLRHDPDVMLIGEIRDSETAGIAVQASLTGHLVFSTLHTNDAAGGITRLEDMGVERFMISSSLVGILAQRLVRKICPHCAEKIMLSRQQINLLADDFNVSADLIPENVKRGKGCEKCGYTGYRGRIGIFEFLVVDDVIQSAIAEGAGRTEIFNKAVERGMVSLRMDGLEKVKNGITTCEEVLRVTR